MSGPQAMNAILSPCGAYRYRLERDGGMEGPVFAFFGMNPSKADATINDQTVCKWIGFVKRWGGSRLIVGNVFAYRATDVKALRSVQQPVGPENFAHLERIAADADVLVPCWGDRGKVPRTLHHHIDKTLAFLRTQGKPVLAFGFAKGGDPLHPLMLGYDTALVPCSVMVQAWPLKPCQDMGAPRFRTDGVAASQPLAPAHAADPRGPEFTRINQHDAIVHPAGVQTPEAQSTKGGA